MEPESSTTRSEAILEALLFAHADPLPAQRILDILEDLDGPGLEAVVASLNQTLESTGRPLVVREIAGGYQMLTRPEFHTWLTRLVKGTSDRLTAAGLETLAIVAYKQPLTRADIESVRGVQSGQIVRTLLDHKLVRITGRAEVIGRPLLYGTTKRFLDQFGLSSLRDLPSIEELQQLLREEDEAKARAAESEVDTGPPIPVDQILAPGLRPRKGADLVTTSESDPMAAAVAAGVPIDIPAPPDFRRELFLAGAEMLRARERSLQVGASTLPEDSWDTEKVESDTLEAEETGREAPVDEDGVESDYEESEFEEPEPTAMIEAESLEPQPVDVVVDPEMAEPVERADELEETSASGTAELEEEPDPSAETDVVLIEELQTGVAELEEVEAEDEPEAIEGESLEFELEGSREEIPPIDEDDVDEPFTRLPESQEQ